jgi:hypothetical protein
VMVVVCDSVAKHIGCNHSTLTAWSGCTGSHCQQGATAPEQGSSPLASLPCGIPMPAVTNAPDRAWLLF